MAAHQNIFLDAFYMPYGFYSPGYLFNKTYNNVNFVQRLALERKLSVHTGCVNTICWNDSGQLILSGSDDQKLVVSNPFNGEVITSIQSGHRANIFSAKFLPNARDRRIISCSGDGLIYYTQLDREDLVHGFDCHFGTAYEVLTVPQDPHSFLSCGEDGTVRWYDLRIKDKCNKEDCKEDVLINCRRAVTAIAVNPVTPYQLAVGCSDSTVRIFDRRMLGTKATGNYTGRGVMGMISRFSAPGLESHYHRITSLSYSRDGEEVLASYSSEHIYLFNLKESENTRPSKEFGAEGTSMETGAKPKTSGKQPPIKRLRLRGDWSDTGPSARPERERGTDGTDHAAATIMQRMSDMLTRWLEGNSRPREEQSDRSSDATANDQTETEGAGSEGEAGTSERGPGPSGGTAQSCPPSGLSDSEAVEASCILGGPLPCLAGARKKAGKITGADVGSQQGAQEDSKNKDQCASDHQGGGTSQDVSGVEYKAAEEIEIGAQLCHPEAKSKNVVSSQKYGAKTDECDILEENSQDPHGDLPESEQSTDNVEVDRTDSDTVTLKHHETLPVKKFSSHATEDNTGIEHGELSQSPEVVSSSTSTDSGQSSTPDHARPLSVSKALSESVVQPLVSLQYQSQGTCASLIRLDCPAVHESASVSCETSAVDSCGQEGLPDLHSMSGDNLTSCSSAIPSDLASTSGSSGGQGLNSRFAANTPGNHSQSASASNDTNSERKATTSEAMAESEGLQMQVSNVSKLEMDSTPEHGHVVTEASPSCSASSSGNDSRPPEKVEITDIACTTEGATASEMENVVPSGDENLAEVVTPGDQDMQSDSSMRSEQEMSDLANDDQSKASTAPGSSGTMRLGAGEGGPSAGSPTDPDGEDNPDEDDSDTERMRAARRSRRGRWGPRTSPSWSYRDDNSAERHVAAIKLQELYRKRQEEREREELMQLPQPSMKKKYRGHRNARTMIKEATFWGENYVMSGSDCGHVFVWDRYTTELVMLLEGDKHVVNCIQPHPFDPVLATSGIDYDIKLWAPTAKEACFDSVRAQEILKRNEVMLEETRDTITVPASFMLRMLASLNHFRNARRTAGPDAESSPSSEEEDD